MKKCSNCGQNNPESNTRCEFCGAAFSGMPGYGAGNVSAGYAPYGNHNQSIGSFAPADSFSNPSNSYGGSYNAPPAYNNGGLIAWAIVTLLFCTIPGIVALVYATGINNCRTYEEQQKKIATAKTWCTAGTILGIITVVLTIFSALIPR